MSQFTELGQQIGELLDQKRACYGNTFDTVPQIMALLASPSRNIPTC